MSLLDLALGTVSVCLDAVRHVVECVSDGVSEVRHIVCRKRKRDLNPAEAILPEPMPGTGSALYPTPPHPPSIHNTIIGTPEEAAPPPSKRRRPNDTAPAATTPVATLDIATAVSPSSPPVQPSNPGVSLLPVVPTPRMVHTPSAFRSACDTLAGTMRTVATAIEHLPERVDPLSTPAADTVSVLQQQPPFHPQSPFRARATMPHDEPRVVVHAPSSFSPFAPSEPPTEVAGGMARSTSLPAPPGNRVHPIIKAFIQQSRTTASLSPRYRKRPLSPPHIFPPSSSSSSSRALHVRNPTPIPPKPTPINLTTSTRPHPHMLSASTSTPRVSTPNHPHHVSALPVSIPPVHHPPPTSAHPPPISSTKASETSPVHEDSQHLALEHALVPPHPSALPPVLRSLTNNAILRQKLEKLNAVNLQRLGKSHELHRLRAQLFLQELDLANVRKAKAHRRSRMHDLELLKKRAQNTQNTPEEEPPADNSPQFDLMYWLIQQQQQQRKPWRETAESLKERKDQKSVLDHNSFFSPLTENALNRLRATMSDDTNLYTDLVSIKGCVIQGQDLRRLKPNCWLNDEIINAYCELLIERSERNVARFGRGKIVRPKIFNSFFYSKLVRAKKGYTGAEYDYDYSRVRRWTRRFNVFTDFDYVLIPINEANLHWTLGVIDIRYKMIMHLDSMGTGGSEHIRDHLRQWILDEAEEKGIKTTANEWKYVSPPLPLQENSDDCGVFCLKYADVISRGWGRCTFKQDHMTYFRARMAHELLMKRA